MSAGQREGCALLPTGKRGAGQITQLVFSWEISNLDCQFHRGDHDESEHHIQKNILSA